MRTPHYLRFARSLALLGSVGAVGCPGTSTLEPDAATEPSIDAFAREPDARAPTEDAFAAEDSPSTPGPDAFSAEDAALAPPDDAARMADANAQDDAGVCAGCVCWGFGPPGDGGTDAGLPDCLTVPGAEICCAAIGPLSPPDLPV